MLDCELLGADDEAVSTLHSSEDFVSVPEIKSEDMETSSAQVSWECYRQQRPLTYDEV